MRSYVDLVDAASMSLDRTEAIQRLLLELFQAADDMSEMTARVTGDRLAVQVARDSGREVRSLLTAVSDVSDAMAADLAAALAAAEGERAAGAAA